MSIYLLAGVTLRAKRDPLKSSDYPLYNKLGEFLGGSLFGAILHLINHGILLPPVKSPISC